MPISGKNTEDGVPRNIKYYGKNGQYSLSAQEVEWRHLISFFQVQK